MTRRAGPGQPFFTPWRVRGRCRGHSRTRSPDLAHQLGPHPRRREERLEALQGRPGSGAGLLPQDELVLEGVLPAGQLGHGDLVAERLERERPDHVGEVGTQLAPVPGVLVQLGDGRVGAAPVGELPGHLGLAAGDQRHVIRAVARRQHDGVVGGGVAGVQRGHQIHPRWNRGARHLGFQEAHAFVAEPGGPLGGGPGQLRARLDAEERPLPGRSHGELVEDEAQVALARAAVHQHRVAEAGEDVVERRGEEPHQVVHLLQLAQAVGVEVAVAGEQVQFLEERLRAPGEELAGHVVAVHLAAHGHVLPRNAAGRSCRRRWRVASGRNSPGPPAEAARDATAPSAARTIGQMGRMHSQRLDRLSEIRLRR